MLNRKPLLVALTACALGAACSDATIAAPASTPPLDVPSTLSRAVAVAFGTYLPGADAVELPDACPATAPPHTFACAPITRGMLTYTLRYELPDPSTVRMTVDVHGARTSPSTDGGTMTTRIDEHRELVATSPHPGTLAFTGAETSHHDASTGAEGAPRSVQDVVAQTIGVRFDDGARWPSAGTITSDATTTIVGLNDAPWTLHTLTTIAFDGSSIALVTTKLDATTIRCRYDLSGLTATTCMPG